MLTTLLATLLLQQELGQQLVKEPGLELTLKPAPSPVDNPMKGLVPYAANHEEFPHSMEFSYLPINAIVKGKNQHNWKALDDLLNDISGRGHQAIIRFFLEYPKEPTGIPQYLLDGGLKVTKWNSESAGSDPAQGLGDNTTPDYTDANLRQCLNSFISALGKNYDGDPRIGYLTMGILGAWGEWHTWPREELFAPVEVQNEVMNVFQRSFSRTPILMRYPRGKGDPRNAENATRPFGFHDDSFAWATLDTGKPEDNWYFMPAMKAAGTLDKWKWQPIGGEIRPEAWGKCFDPKPDRPEIQTTPIQDFEKCVRTTHATWLMDSGMFSEEIDRTPQRVKRAEEMVRLMGYDFTVSKARIQAGAGFLVVNVTVKNQGVAPFYPKWPLRVGLMDARKAIVRTFKGELGLENILPGTTVDRYFSATLSGLERGKYTLLLSCPNPLTNGHPVGFANESYGKDQSGWLTLGSITL